MASRLEGVCSFLVAYSKRLHLALKTLLGRLLAFEVKFVFASVGLSRRTQVAARQEQ